MANAVRSLYVAGSSLFPFIVFNAFNPPGYYLATMEAAVQHISDLAKQYQAILEQEEKITAKIRADNNGVPSAAVDSKSDVPKETNM